jgi:hypothetical protein
MSTEIGALVNLTIAGKDFAVRPTFAVLIRAEKRVGSLLSLLGRLGDGQALTCEEASGILFEAINAEHPRALGYAAIATWASSGMESLTQAVGAAAEILVAGMPKPREGVDASPPTAA